MRNDRLHYAFRFLGLMAMVLTAGGCFESKFLAKRIAQQHVERQTDRPPPPTIGGQAEVELPDSETIAVDGMVGKINGRPIYVRQVFDPLEEQLRARGRRMPVGAFRNEAAQIIALHLRGLVTREKLLAQAKRDLNEREQEFLNGMIQQRREEQIRKWGEGSPIVADKRLREAEGKGLERDLEDYRAQMVVQRYLLRKFRPEINVTRKTVERYYERNKDRYSPPPGRVVRVVCAQSDSDARRITQLLEKKADYEAVASDRANLFHRKEGLISEKFTEAEPFAQPELNQALGTLAQGQWTSPITINDQTWWLYLERFDNEQGKTLEDVQLEIEAELVDSQFALLVDRYRLTLIDEQTLDTLADMTDRLAEVAVNRFALAQGG